MRIAITREVSPTFANCELTHLERQPIDIDMARDQHRRYEEALWSLGCELRTLPAEPELPDAVLWFFVGVRCSKCGILDCFNDGKVGRGPMAEATFREIAGEMPYRPG